MATDLSLLLTLVLIHALVCYLHFSGVELAHDAHADWDLIDHLLLLLLSS